MPSSPTDLGRVELLVGRPQVGTREVVERAVLDERLGFVGDSWIDRPSRRTADGGPHPGMQLTLANSRVVDLIAGGDRSRWPLAGDQLYVDLDLSAANLPPGTRLAVGTAIVEVTDVPHTGCAKFADRFGVDAVRFVSTPAARLANLRGINARVVTGGEVVTGDVVRVLR
ncbi:MOSC domain-containing protein [Nitriliruptoraceae bacterium ZYF776]|nr:MOSC domain-containing protein [Profundirhabdus halotolerans]